MLIPLPKDVISRLSYPTIEEYSNIIMATLLNNIDFSRLKATALANDKKIKLTLSIFAYFITIILSRPPLLSLLLPEPFQVSLTIHITNLSTIHEGCSAHSLNFN